MPKLIHWEDQIGRRLRLRDLSVFFTVVEYGSMAKAAGKLGVSTPSISEVIAALEHALGVRLLDRSPQGVVVTPYGEALLTRGRAAFDELRQGIRDLEFISDPRAGELRIGCPESIAAGFLVPVLERISREYPRLRFHVVQVHTPTVEFPELHERKVDLVLARLVKHPVRGRLDEDLNAEVLFDDPFSLVVSDKSKWARRKKLELADLVDEPWIMTPLDALGGSLLADAFGAQGLKAPSLIITTFSLHLRNNLVSSGRFLTALPRSVLQTVSARLSLKGLPIELPVRPSPVAIVTLRNRTLAPAVDLFIQCARETARSFAAGPRVRRAERA
jgi:DNA-binding transcriptional LysR family regulator